jgi:hypothetical protein
MIDDGILITAAIGAFSTFTSGFSGWFFARRKYNSEVDTNLIRNMQNSLDFYDKLCDDTAIRLDEVLKRNDNLETEVRELRQQVMNLMANLCTDLSCQVRKRNFNDIKSVIKQREGI